jgi:TorA maturation chaperone TorD
MAENAAAVAAPIPEEDLLRAQFYWLIARLLLAPPQPDFLARIAALEEDNSEIGQALGQLARIAGHVSPDAAAEEYQALFIGVARGELVPYGSYYLTGFLNEKPLAKLRQDMARLGVARAEKVTEPEDHMGTLCEIMAGLIAGEFGAPADLAMQRRFFDAHIAPWAMRFFADLERAQAARLYAPVGRLGRAFMDVEATGFDMEG